MKLPEGSPSDIQMQDYSRNLELCRSPLRRWRGSRNLTDVMKPRRLPASAVRGTCHYARRMIFWVSLVLLALVPLIFSTGVHRMFTLPKVVLLLAGSAILVGLMGIVALSQTGERLRALRTRYVVIPCLYVGAIALSTVRGVAPRVALFGSFENQMGLITRLCFLICFFSLILSIGHTRARLQRGLWTITITGLVAATYGFAQFFGRDPFLSARLYTFDSTAGRIVRVISTLGHADYLGNFLLYTTPVSAAVALVARGRARLLGLIVTLLSMIVIIFTGTRGAIAGLVIGALAFALFASWRRDESIALRDHRSWRRGAIAALMVLATMVLIVINPASSNLVARARAAVAEGASGSGRTLLWRDSLAMLPAYGLTGCGPEGFRKAFLPYKSKELAQLAPLTNNESPHNAYLDAAISNGLPGAILYTAVLTSALMRLWRARRVADKEMKTICTGLLAALAAVATHNLFIFDQIPTGLYFFAFAALAQAAFNVANGETVTSAAVESIVTKPLASLWLNRAMAVTGLILLIVALWYGFALVRSDVEMRLSYEAARAGDFEGTLRAGRRAADGLDPVAGYRFEMARSLALFADVAQAKLSVAHLAKAEADELQAARLSAINEAAAAGQASLVHTVTPDSNYLLLAYLASLSKDPAKLRAYATEAQRLDPYFANNHWLMAEGFLMAGDAPAAQREAEVALELNPYSIEARQLFKRARGDEDETVEGLLARAKRFVSDGKLHKARRRLLRALQESVGDCLECHRTLALVYEAEGKSEKAIAEWQAVAAAASDEEKIAQAQSHIAILKEQAAPH